MKIKDKSEKIKVKKKSIYVVPEYLPNIISCPDGRAERLVPTCYVGIARRQAEGMASSAIQNMRMEFFLNY